MPTAVIYKSEIDIALNQLRGFYKSFKSSAEYAAENGKTESERFNRAQMQRCQSVARLLQKIDAIPDPELNWEEEQPF